MADRLTATGDRLRPMGRLHAGGAQHPFAERQDQAGFLGQRDEVGRRDHAALGMIPAHQRLEAGDLAGLQVEDRLVVDLELAVGDGLAQVELERAARLQPLVHLALEEAVRAAAVALGEVERHVGVLQQQVGVGAVVRRDGDADAGADHDMPAVDVVGPADQLDDARGELAALLGPADVGLHHREFVAADARHEVGGRHRLDQTGRHELEQLVADRMAERVVDGLEMIEIEAMHGKAAARLDAVEGVLQMLAEQHAVRQIGQHVVPRQMRDLGLGAAALGDVLVHRDPAAVLHRPLRHRDDAAVHQLLGEGGRLAGMDRGRRRDLLRIGDGAVADRGAIVLDRLEQGAGLGQLGRQRVHLHIGLVADDQLLLGVEHAQPVGHVVQRDVDAAVELLELDLAGDELDGVVLEHRHRARHGADLVAVVARGDHGRGVVAGEAGHRLGDASEPRQHPVHGGKPDRADQHDRRERATAAPTPQATSPSR